MSAFNLRVMIKTKFERCPLRPSEHLQKGIERKLWHDIDI